MASMLSVSTLVACGGTDPEPEVETTTSVSVTTEETTLVETQGAPDGASPEAMCEVMEENSEEILNLAAAPSSDEEIVQTTAVLHRMFTEMEAVSPPEIRGDVTRIVGYMGSMDEAYRTQDMDAAIELLEYEDIDSALMSVEAYLTPHCSEHF